MNRVDVAIVGAGAAGLMAAIHAAEAEGGATVALLDGAARLGRKILISGGGRCNVTHDEVTERDFAGGRPAAIRKVLRGFDAAATRAFFEASGVRLVREETTGKLFPSTHKARTVLEALIARATAAGARFLNPWRVEALAPATEGQGFVLEGPAGTLAARTVVLATGGRSVPETGSDGHGYVLARALGHTLTPRIVPALVPLLLPEGHPLTTLKGVSLEAVLEVVGPGGQKRHATRGAVLFTHFGLSGPGVLDVSRHWILAREDEPGTGLRASFLPDETPERVDAWLREDPAETLGSRLQARLPRRLAALLLKGARVDEGTRLAQLPRAARRELVGALTAHPLPVTGPRGWRYAEVTAGGVPLEEVDLARLESRPRAGLFLCGEILDVDGRIGGFNFQWAWSSGALAGRAAARSALACRLQP